MSNSLTHQLATRTLVLYDGYCALCNNVVHFLIHRDTQDKLRFAPAHRQEFQPFLARHAIPNTTQPETILALINYGNENETLLTHSSAILKLMGELKQPWPAIAGILRLVPRPIRDFFYRIIARNRFRLKKRLTTCPIPTETERRHFIV